MKKFFRTVLLLLFLIILAILAIGFFIGYGYYSKALKEKPLLSRVEEVTTKDNYVSFNELPKDYVHAVIAIEDKRFYDHGGVDFIAIARALFTNIKNEDFDEGGSTITQQVAKNIVFSQEKTFERKLGEIFAAYDLEKNYSKDEIFALYANSIYFGDGYYCIYDASMGYYDKEPEELDLDECSMLAGIPNAPSLYSPTVNLQLAKERQAQVLDKMLEEKYITKEQANSIK